MAVPKEWVKNPSDELAEKEGCTFDAAAGKAACDFIESYCRLSEGRWVGEPVRLIPWQRDWFMRLFGWKRPDGFRRYQTTYCEVAKKNGKSPITSGVACHGLLGEDEGGPKVYINACDREQARIVFEHAANMVRQSPDLAEVLEVIDSRNRIVCRDNMGVIIANSAVVDAKDGRNASLVIFDELHRQPNRKLWNVFQGAGASRQQPINLSITTAGEAEEGVWFEQREYSEGVASGKIPDITHLGIVHRADPNDDFDDPAVWAKANPSLGYTITPEQFKRDLEKAKLFPLDWNDFLRKRFNVIASSSEAFFPAGAWERCRGEVDPESLRGQPCYVGVDLSSVNDLTAAVAVFPGEDGTLTVIPRFYLPEDNIAELERQHRQPYRHWASNGHMTLTPGASVDYAFVRRDINDLARAHDLRSVLVDPCNATQITTELAESDGLPVQTIAQTVTHLNAPTKELLRLVSAGKLRHGGHPVLDWNARNAVAVRDVNDNIRLSKKKSRQKIDGMAALVNAVAAATAGGDGGGSVYEERGILVI